MPVFINTNHIPYLLQHEFGVIRCAFCCQVLKWCGSCTLQSNEQMRHWTTFLRVIHTWLIPTISNTYHVIIKCFSLATRHPAKTSKLSYIIKNKAIFSHVRWPISKLYCCSMHYIISIDAVLYKYHLPVPLCMICNSLDIFSVRICKVRNLVL